MYLPDSHIVFSSAEDVQKICGSLQSFSPHIYFGHLKIYRHNQTHIKLTMNPTVQKRLYHERYVYEGFLYHCNYLFSLGTGIHRASEWMSKKYCSTIQSVFNINLNNFFDLVINTDHYHEIFEFGCTDTEINFPDFFLQNLALFKRFCLYFKDRAKSLIREAEKHPIDLHQGYQPISNTQGSLQQLCKEKWPIDKRAFLKEIDFRRCQFEDPAIANIIFSKREFECALALIRGETAQSTAEQLFLSRRTVETHIEELKNKLGCLNKGELKKKLLESSVLKFYQDCI